MTKQEQAQFDTAVRDVINLQADLSALQRNNEELRAALREIAGLDGGTILTHLKLAKAKEIARAALGEK